MKYTGMPVAIIPMPMPEKKIRSEVIKTMEYNGVSNRHIGPQLISLDFIAKCCKTCPQKVSVDILKAKKVFVDFLKEKRFNFA